MTSCQLREASQHFPTASHSCYPRTHRRPSKAPLRNHLYKRSESSCGKRNSPSTWGAAVLAQAPCSSELTLAVRCRADRTRVSKAEVHQLLAAEVPDVTVEELLLARIIADDGDTGEYVVTDCTRERKLALGDALNCHIDWYGDARAAVVVSADLRQRILELYDAYLAPDGRAVDYDGMAGDSRFAAYVDATVELRKVDIGEMNRTGKFS
jgi:hypothetical protein